MRKPLTIMAALALVAAPVMAKDAPKATAGKEAARAPVTSAQPQKLDAARLEAARKLLQVTGSDKLAEQMVHMMVPQIANFLIRAKPEKKDEIVKILKGVIKEQTKPETMNRLRETLARIYAQEFTTEEMKKIIAFFETPEGRKFVQKMPSIMAKSQRAGMIWSREVGGKIIEQTRKQAKAKGIDLGGGK